MFFTVTVRIEKPVREVWPAFMDEGLLPKWLSGLQSMTLMSGKAGAAGSQHKLVFRERGKDFVMMEDVVEVVPEKLFSFRLKHKHMHSHTDVHFIDKGHSTVVESESTVHGKGIMKLFLPFFKGKMRAQQEKDYGRFKVLVESIRYKKGRS